MSTTPVSSIQLTLWLGKFVPTPAPADLMNALQSVEITQNDTTTGFQIVFQAERSKYMSQDYPLLSNGLLQPGNRVVLSVTINGTPQVLLDGIITHHQFTPTNNGPTLLTVTGEDISVMMDMYEVALDFPGMGDYEIVLLVLTKYAALGIIPTVIPPLTNILSLPIEHIPQQSSTDKHYLQALAAEHGYIFFVRPGFAPLQNFAYWGPLNRIGIPQKALTIDAGPATNVESIQFSYDALAPGQVYGAVSDEEAELVLPILPLPGTLLPPLASQQPLIENQPFVRQSLLPYQGSSFVDAISRAQSLTNASVANVVTAEGTLDALRYGGILTAPGLVGVRGVGFTYDGYYYVRSVTHQISRGRYKQSFSLSREGTGSITTGVLV